MTERARGCGAQASAGIPLTRLMTTQAAGPAPGPADAEGGARDVTPLASSPLAPRLRPLVQNPTWRTVRAGVVSAPCRRKSGCGRHPTPQGKGARDLLTPATRDTASPRLHPLPCLPPPGKGRPLSLVPGPSALVNSRLGLWPPVPCRCFFLLHIHFLFLGPLPHLRCESFRSRVSPGVRTPNRSLNVCRAVDQ